MMDENSLVVSYDAKRGEPRKGSEGVLKENEGDCINCYNCVKVCPTGIDIRRGTQLECIACTQCIDACDDIMTKLHKPKGLIRYSSEVEVQGQKRRKMTKRSFVYLFFASLFISLFFVFLNQSTKLDLVFLRDKVPFQVQNNGSLVVNHFTLKITHQGEDQFKIDFRMKNPKLRSIINILTPIHPVQINKPEKKIILFFKFPPSLLENGTRKELIEVVDVESNIVLATKEVSLVGPVE